MSLSFFFFKQKTAYEMRISDWSSDVCSSDLLHLVALIGQFEADADAAEIIAQLTAKGCSGLGVELRVEAIVRLGPCVDDGEIGIVEVSNSAKYGRPETPITIRLDGRTEERRVGKEGVGSGRIGGGRSK